jgi:predicted amidophosphoribosyltransferase
LRAALRTALDLALPTLYPACREPVEGCGLCPACWSKLSFITRPYCERLGIPFVYDPGPGILSMEAIADPPGYRRARAAVRSTRFHGRWSMPSNTAIGSIWRR